MKKLLIGVAALPFLASVAMAGEPLTLADSQMDSVTAGHNQRFNGITIHYPDWYGSPASTFGTNLCPGTGLTCGPTTPTPPWNSFYGPAPTILTGANATSPPPNSLGIYHRVP